MASLLTLMHFHCEEQRGWTAGLAHPIQVISEERNIPGSLRWDITDEPGLLLD